MKKLAFALVGALILVCAACQKSAPDPEAIRIIKETVDAANTQLPMYMGMGNDVCLEAMKYVDGNVVYEYTVDRLENDMSKSDTYKKVLVNTLKLESESNPDTKKFIEQVLKAQANIVYSYTASNGNTMSVELDADDLESVL